MVDKVFVRFPNTNAMSTNSRPNPEAMSPTRLALFSIVGVLLIGALFGGAWLYLSHQKQKEEEEAYYAQQERLREKHEKSLAEHRERERQAEAEEKQKAEDERLAVIRDSGLTPYQIAARELYMEMWDRDFSMTKTREIMKEWFPKVDVLRKNETAIAELKSLSLDPFEIYHLGSYLREERELAEKLEGNEALGFTPEHSALVEKELREEYRERKESNDAIVGKWDAAFGLTRGKAKSAEETELFQAQAEAARVDVLPPISTEEAISDYGNTGDVIDAWVYMKLFVEQNLKNPRGAKFPFGGHRNVVNLGGDRYRVRSYVDATNSFGATVRTNFVGVVKRRYGGWDLESLNFE